MEELNPSISRVRIVCFQIKSPLVRNDGEYKAVDFFGQCMSLQNVRCSNASSYILNVSKPDALDPWLLAGQSPGLLIAVKVFDAPHHKLTILCDVDESLMWLAIPAVFDENVATLKVVRLPNELAGNLGEVSVSVRKEWLNPQENLFDVLSISFELGCLNPIKYSLNLIRGVQWCHKLRLLEECLLVHLKTWWYLGVVKSLVQQNQAHRENKTLVPIFITEFARVHRKIATAKCFNHSFKPLTLSWQPEFLQELP